MASQHFNPLIEGERLNLISKLEQQILQVFSNDADATDGLTMQSTLKSPTIKYWIAKREGTGNYRNKPLFQTNH